MLFEDDEQQLQAEPPSTSGQNFLFQEDKSKFREGSKALNQAPFVQVPQPKLLN